MGKEAVAEMSSSMRNWYGPPIAIQGVPGNVVACAGGDFHGKILAGSEVSATERAETLLKKSEKARRLHVALRMKQAGMAGFTSLSDLQAEAKAGKREDFSFYKTMPTGVTGVFSSCWGIGPLPAAGANAAAAPGGESPTSTTTGAFPMAAVSTDTRHFVYGESSNSLPDKSMLMYDRIFQVNTTMNSTATEAVTGVPTRYQSITVTNPDYIGGNFLFVEVGGTALAATAHNWTVCTYLDQDNAASTLPSITGNSGAIVRRLDHPASQWFAPLASGDTGIKALTQMQCSALVATGVINFVIGHPLAYMPHSAANLVCMVDGIITSFNLVRIFDNAAIAFLSLSGQSAASNITGKFTTVAG